MQDNIKPTQARRTRPEAHPYDWDKLTGDQQLVAETLHKYLCDFVSLPLEPKRSPGPFNWRPDHYRESNVILIDGSRGSGKTSVLLTIIDLWLRVLRGEPTGKAPPFIVESLQRGDLAGKLIPLRILDLQPLPRSTSLLTWIAGRLLEFVDDLEGVDARERGQPPAAIGSWNPKWDVELPSRKAWRELLQDAAVGWESNLAQRRRDLDPESYAVELGQAERARLSIQDRWREFVDHVAADAYQRLRGIKQDARFVLSIDDADMNPHRCVELLDLLRMFWHPRLVFVLTGETNLFIKTLQLHYFGRFHETVGPVALSESEHKSIIPKPDALGLAWNVYNKAIPRGQRFALAALQPDERLRLLQQELAIQLHREAEDLPPSTLAGYFELDPRLRNGLPDRLRRVQDLKQQLHTPSSQARASKAIYQIWRDLVRESDLSPGIEHALLDSIQLRDERLFIRLSGSISWKSQSSIKRKFQDSAFPLKISLTAGFELLAASETKIRIPEALTAALLLALNICVDETDGELPFRELPHGFDYPLVSATVSLSRNREANFVWPMPNWATPLEYNLVMSVWTRSSLQQALSGTNPGILALRFVSAIMDSNDRRIQTEQAQDEKDPWEKLSLNIANALERLVHGKPQGPRRQREFDRWLCESAGLLATPESGLPSGVANKILGTLISIIPVEHQHQLMMKLKLGRLARAKEALSKIVMEKNEDASFILRKIDETNPTFEWGFRVEDRVVKTQAQKPAEALLKELHESLDKIHVHHDPSSSAKTPETMEEYVNTVGVGSIFLSQPATEIEKLTKRLKQVALATSPTNQALLEIWGVMLESMSPADRTQSHHIIVKNEAGLSVELPQELKRIIEEPTRRRKEVMEEKQARNGLVWQVYALASYGNIASTSPNKFAVLAHDIIADETDVSSSEQTGSFQDDSRPGNMSWAAALPGASIVYLFRGKQVHIDWPVPNWPSFMDWHLTEELWTKCLSSAERYGTIITYDFPDTIRKFLGQIDTIANGRRLVELSFSNWPSALNWVVNYRQFTDIKGIRWNRIREWAEVGAVLFGAPELGLASDACRKILLKLKPDDNPQKIARIVTARRLWAQRALRHAGLEHDESAVNRFLKEMDGLEHNHPWHEFIGTNDSHLLDSSSQ